MRARLKYCPELDGLRCLAAVAVILVHSHPGGPFRGGYVGVDIFFVLSGFLITSLLIEEHRRTDGIDLAAFYWRRFTRLMPAFLLVLTTYVAVAPYVWPDYPHARDAVLACLYLSDYSQAFFQTPRYLDYTWSLSVEEHFYLLWPVAILGLLRTRDALRFLIWAFAGATLWRFASADNWQLYYFRFDTHASGLIAGAALAFGLAALKPTPTWAAAGAVALLSLCFVSSTETAWISITLAEIASLMLIAAVASGNGGILGSLLRRPTMVAGGKLSYAMYLWHYPFAWYARAHWGFLPTAAATLAFSVTMAAVSYWTVEAFGRGLRRGGRNRMIAMPT